MRNDCNKMNEESLRRASRSGLLAIVGRLLLMAEPPPLIAPWKWAEDKRLLPSYNAEPGKMLSERAPWTRDITEAVINPIYSEIISVQGSQTSKTDGVLINTLGWQADYRRKPMLYYCPTESNAYAISMRIQAMIHSVPSLYAALDKRRMSFDQYFIYGVRIGLGWAGSATQVSSHPAEIVLFDELDRIKDIPGEGNAWQLTKVRSSTFTSRTQVGTSSPTLGLIEDEKHPETGLIHWKYNSDKTMVLSLSWQLWQEGTRGEFMLPCPSCNTYFAPKAKLLYLPEDFTPMQAFDEVQLICPHCGSLIEPTHQHRMIDKGLMICPGQWVENGKVMGEKPRTPIASFHVNGLCSRWVDWRKRAFELVRTRKTGDEGRIQSVINTEFGECYWTQGRAPMWEEIAQYRKGANYVLGEVPPYVQALTAGVDVQANRLVVVVMGWSYSDGELEGWLIEYEEIFGNTSEYEVWDSFAENYLQRDFNGFYITETGVDSGFNPSARKKSEAVASGANRNIIYEFCREQYRVVPTKGANKQMAKPYHSTPIDMDHRGRNLRHGITLYTVDTDFFRKDLYSKLSHAPDDGGCWHFPSDTPDKFFQELTAAQLADDGSWIERRDNHVLDAMIINMFVAYKNKFVQTLPESSRENRVNASVRTRQVVQKIQSPVVEPKREQPKPKRKIQQGGEWWDD